MRQIFLVIFLNLAVWLPAQTTGGDQSAPAPAPGPGIKVESSPVVNYPKKEDILNPEAPKPVVKPEAKTETKPVAKPETVTPGKAAAGPLPHGWFVQVALGPNDKSGLTAEILAGKLLGWQVWGQKAGTTLYLLVGPVKPGQAAALIKAIKAAGAPTAALFRN